MLKQKPFQSGIKKFDGKKDEYDGCFLYDDNNESEKDTVYYKLKDKWYFVYNERRPH